jgi:hypothetical protein
VTRRTLKQKRRGKDFSPPRSFTSARRSTELVKHHRKADGSATIFAGSHRREQTISLDSPIHAEISVAV